MIRKSCLYFKSRIRPLSGHCGFWIINDLAEKFLWSGLTWDTSGMSVCSTERVWISSPQSKFPPPHGDEAIPADPTPTSAHHNTEFAWSLSIPQARVWFSLKDPSVCSPLYIPRTRFWVKDCSCICNIPNYNHRTDWWLLQPLASLLERERERERERTRDQRLTAQAAQYVFGYNNMRDRMSLSH